MCLNETCSKVWAGKQLTDMFPFSKVLIQEDARLTLVFIFALDTPLVALRCTRMFETVTYTSDNGLCLRCTYYRPIIYYRENPRSFVSR